ncbi:putative autophagy-related protein 11 [Tribolium castaneum]|uniref:CCDC113/CCDC96 coiled-coil domain-containing protein n=1 Tax=Tribolium castaneum TaxID=7070 RepID=A0A139WDP5_TRICA|nr:PREDICTED: uncharacterized protein PFB0765w [Tribolium castaneum]KYB25987.1 hypothetical protein TcasGA2_TC034019 [Tribolium castaneum]|eukprot:XP_008196628.1 PREDICTED: uncharacterized protein PFB0765w [Tribolium castaneum]
MSENFDPPPKLPDREDANAPQPGDTPNERRTSDEKRRVKVSLPEIELNQAFKEEKPDDYLSLKSVSLSSIWSILKKDAERTIKEETEIDRDLLFASAGSEKSAESSRKTVSPPRSIRSEHVSGPEMSDVYEQPMEHDDISYAIPEDFITKTRRSTVSSSIHFVSDDFVKCVKSLDMATIAEEDETREFGDEDIEDIAIDRKLYSELYTIFEIRRYKEKLINNYLQARLAKYYMRRKMFYVLREMTPKVDEVIAKYHKDLESLEHLCDSAERDKALNNEEIKNLTLKRDAKVVDLETLFKNLIHMEQEFAKTLTLEKTGRTNVDKMTERFVRRQKNQTNLLIKLRMSYINLRNRFNEKMTTYENLDSLGPGYGIMDYVQLKADNRKLYDILEEKEAELTKLRLACKDTIQVLAHNREKSQVVNLDIEKLKEELQVTETELNDAREQLNYLKRERDNYRKIIKNIRLEYGLLTNPKLLRDMESAINEIDVLKDDIERTKNKYFLKRKQTEAVRRNMELYLAERKREEGRRLKILESVSSLEIKKKPTLVKKKSEPGMGFGSKKSVSIVDLPKRKKD